MNAAPGRPDARARLTHAGVGLTLLAGLAAGASAQTEIYGKFYPEVANIRLGEARSPSETAGTLAPAGGEGAARSEVQFLSSNSYAGFRGRESTGSGIVAIWQFEIGYDVGNGAWAQRDSFIGLETPAATLRIGFMDTVYKDLGDQLRFFGLSSGNFVSSSTVLSKPATGASSAASFHLRRPNSIRIDGNQKGPLSWHVQYSPDETFTSGRDANLLSVGVAWSDGPWYLAIADETHRDFFGGSRTSPRRYRNDGDPSASSRDRGTRATVVYQLTSAMRASFDRAWLRYRETTDSAGRFGAMNYDAWTAAIDYRSGRWRGQVSYSRGSVRDCQLTGDSGCDVAGEDGWMLNAGVGYTLSKRTMLFALAGRVHNGPGAAFNPTENFDVLAGQSVTQYALGVLHRF